MQPDFEERERELRLLTQAHQQSSRARNKFSAVFKRVFSGQVLGLKYISPVLRSGKEGGEQRRSGSGLHMVGNAHYKTAYLTTRKSPPDHFIKFACHFPDILERSSLPKTPPCSKANSRNGGWLSTGPTSPGTKTTAEAGWEWPEEGWGVEGGEEKPASHLRKLGPAGRLRLWVASAPPSDSRSACSHFPPQVELLPGLSSGTPHGEEMPPPYPYCGNPA